MIFATENDSLNGACMLLGYLLTNTAQIFADVRTYWSPESVKRVAGHSCRAKAKTDWCISSIPARRRLTARAGKPAMASRP